MPIAKKLPKLNEAALMQKLVTQLRADSIRAGVYWVDPMLDVMGVLTVSTDCPEWIADHAQRLAGRMNGIKSVDAVCHKGSYDWASRTYFPPGVSISITVGY